GGRGARERTRGLDKEDGSGGGKGTALRTYPILHSKKKERLFCNATNLEHEGAFPFHRFPSLRDGGDKGNAKKRDWLCIIDLKDAYLHVKLHYQSRKFVQYRLKGRVYQSDKVCDLPGRHPCDGGEREAARKQGT